MSASSSCGRELRTNRQSSRICAISYPSFAIETRRANCGSFNVIASAFDERIERKPLVFLFTTLSATNSLPSHIVGHRKTARTRSNISTLASRSTATEETTSDLVSLFDMIPATKGKICESIETSQICASLPAIIDLETKREGTQVCLTLIDENSWKPPLRFRRWDVRL